MSLAIKCCFWCKWHFRWLKRTNIHRELEKVPKMGLGNRFWPGLGRFGLDHFFVTWAVLGAYITVFFDSKWFLMVLWGLKNVFWHVFGSKVSSVAIGRPKVVIFWCFFGPPKWPYIARFLSTRCENTYIYFCKKDTLFCGGKCLLITCKVGNAALLGQAAHFFTLFRGFSAQNRPKLAQKWPFFGPFSGFVTV